MVLCSALIECTNSADLQTVKTLMVAFKADSKGFIYILNLQKMVSLCGDSALWCFQEVNDAYVGCHKKR